MVPKEKAIQLVVDFMDMSEEQEYNTPRYMSKDMAKQCALRTVDELIDWVGDHTYWWIELHSGETSSMLGNKERGYHEWRAVKAEIEKL